MTPRTFVLLALFCAPIVAQVPDSAGVVTAGALAMTRAEFEQLLSGDPRFENAAGTASAKRALGVEIGKAFALEAEARRLKLDQSATVQLRIRNYTQQLLAHELLVALRAGYLAKEAELSRHYLANQQLFSQPRVRQILVQTPVSTGMTNGAAPGPAVEEARAKAAALRAKLAAGADFGALAKAESDDMASRDTGGDLGFVARGSTTAAFEAAAYSLPLSELSEPVQTELGFHILRVEERRPMPFASVKAMIANDLAHREMDAIIQNGFTLNDAYFVP